MELKDFVKGVIADIVSACEESQSELDARATVNPLNIRNEHDSYREPVPEPTSIDFDVSVSVTTSDADASNGGGKISVASVVSAGVGKGHQHTQSSGDVARVRFSIAVLLPIGDTKAQASVLRHKGS
ncbi:MAG: hypothetical protein LIO91_03450 [Bacteroidales bacterium]|nr:hypothetical protein [Bacteroidales bacterium]